MILTDEEIIEVIAKRMDEECGWSDAVKVLDHTGWLDVATHLYMEKGLRPALLEAYQGEIASAMALKELTEWKESGMEYLDWKADVKTRGGA